ncbi:CBM1 domain-containing protein [Rhodotorula toruloides]|uniref:CBM1 domain-containing protein n=1 Tax=Rhodotorula toruloides TaxID=5286 RepID=A0A2T0ADL7_RHOTO|nr:CBM1 domain-containing protein [Rhodotorula toruloides]PRQ76105.1 hypothetical protein AAT19DRAFT_13127 [Rhodotorula toruloides]
MHLSILLSLVTTALPLALVDAAPAPAADVASTDSYHDDGHCGGGGGGYGGKVDNWGRCGGKGYKGPTECEDPLPPLAQARTARSASKVTARRTRRRRPAARPRAPQRAGYPHSTSTTASHGGYPTGYPSTAPAWGQCGGKGWHGPTTCGAGYVGKYHNDGWSIVA